MTPGGASERTTEFPRGQGETLRRMAVAANYYEWLLERSRPYPRGRVLDAGAGSGTFTEMAAADAQQVFAAEPNPELVAML